MFKKVAAWVITLLTSSSIRAFAFKVFLKVLIFTMLPVVIMTGFNLIFGQIISWIALRIAEVEVSQIQPVSLTGFAAYLYYELGIDIALSTLLSAYSIKFTLRSIPFLNL